MAARDVLKNMNLWIDGNGMAGQIQELNLPKLTLQTEEFRGGGMDAPVDLTMGIEKLVTDFSLISYDLAVLGTWGVREGQTIPLTIRAALESYDGTITPVMVNMRGKVTELDAGTWTPGAVPSLKVTMTLNYFKQTHGGVVIHEIDVINMVRVIDGVDGLAAQRAALGL